jgi:hypothetical protein
MGHLHVNGMWFGMAPRMHVRKTHVFEEIELHAQNLIAILSSIVNLIDGGVGVHDHLIKHDNLHFDYE